MSDRRLSNPINMDLELLKELHSINENIEATNNKLDTIADRLIDILRLSQERNKNDETNFGELCRTLNDIISSIGRLE